MTHFAECAIFTVYFFCRVSFLNNVYITVLYKRFHCELRKQSVKKSQQKYPFRTWAQHTISTHKRKGIIVTLTKQEIEVIAKETSTCPLCNCTLTYNKCFSDCSASLDRIANNKPLSIGNAQILCYRCNNAKRAMSMDEFKTWVKMVYNNLNK